MRSWGDFVDAEPELAAKGRHLLTQYGLGLGFLATVAADGRPRLHPITLGIHERELFSFIAPGPKQRDLQRDGAFALHAFLPDEVEEEFVVSGIAALAPGEARDASLESYHLKNIPADHLLFWFRFDRALHAAYRFRGDWPPTYSRWRA
jgi:hypothetical protein